MKKSFKPRQQTPNPIQLSTPERDSAWTLGEIVWKYFGEEITQILLDLQGDLEPMDGDQHNLSKRK